MRPIAVAIVVLGLALTTGLGLAAGLDAAGIVILALVFVVGGLALAVTRKSGGGIVQPAECGTCGGLVSPNAPYCKHCGADPAATA